ncbi:MAG: hypothetical protein GX682_06625 [Clostridiaceae bacterium]|nr:hypothetical protein [Clostridiaceae bacterium]
MANETTLVFTEGEQVLVNPIAKRFFDNLDSAAKEYLDNGSISIYTYSKILGVTPNVPLTDNEFLLAKAYKDFFKDYSNLISDLELKIKNYAKKKVRS